MTQQRIDQLEAKVKEQAREIQDLELTIYLHTRLDQMFIKPKAENYIALDGRKQ